MNTGFSSFNGGFDFFSTLIPIFMVIIFIIVIVGIISSGARYVKNSSSPRESRFATIISKRMDVRHHTTHHHDDNFAHSSSSRTDYYITLEFDNGERREYLDVKNIFGLVREGDVGYAAIQGDWIVAFERSPGKNNNSSTQF